MRRQAHWISALTAICAGVALAVPAGADHFAGLPGSPDLRSDSVLVTDRHGGLIFGKDADSIRPVASITKLMTAMVTLDGGLDLDESITITRADRDLVQLTGSRLDYGARLSRRELLLLAVMASENRAAAALGRTWPEGTAAFVQAMNGEAARIGMRHTRFADPAGLRTDNTSTARDLGALVRAAYGYPLLRQASTLRQLEVHPYPNRGPLRFGNTNRLLGNPNWNIGLSKTGYLNEAGRCLVMQAEIDGESVYIILLDSFGKLTPFGDSNRLRRWLLGGG